MVRKGRLVAKGFFFLVFFVEWKKHLAGEDLAFFLTEEQSRPFFQCGPGGAFFHQK